MHQIIALRLYMLSYIIMLSGIIDKPSLRFTFAFVLYPFPKRAFRVLVYYYLPPSQAASAVCVTALGGSLGITGLSGPFGFLTGMYQIRELAIRRGYGY